MVITEDKPLVDRRDYARFAFNTDAFVILPFAPRRGRLINISEGGLAFHYTAGDGPSPRETVSLQINGAGVLLEDIRLITIYDFEVKATNYFDVKPKRQSGARFEGLTPQQSAKLEHLIRNYTLWTQTWF